VTRTNSEAAPITGLQAAAYRIPTDCPEADGTFAWDATTLIVVPVTCCNLPTRFPRLLSGKTFTLENTRNA